MGGEWSLINIFILFVFWVSLGAQAHFSPESIATLKDLLTSYLKTGMMVNLYVEVEGA